MFSDTVKSSKKRPRIYFLVWLPLVLFLGFLSSQPVTYSQLNPKPVSPLNKDKPSVYILFVGQSESYETCSLKKQPTYQLSLVNNSPRPINVEARYGNRSPLLNLTLNDGTKVQSLPDKAQVELCYDIDSVIRLTSKNNNGKLETEIPVKTKLPDIPIYCTCGWVQDKSRRDSSSGLWISSGSSVIFNVPRQYLDEELKISTIFNYEWEFENGSLKSNEPHHQVFFYSPDNP